MSKFIESSHKELLSGRLNVGTELGNFAGAFKVVRNHTSAEVLRCLNRVGAVLSRPIEYGLGVVNHQPGRLRPKPHHASREVDALPAVSLAGQFRLDPPPKLLAVAEEEKLLGRRWAGTSNGMLKSTSKIALTTNKVRSTSRTSGRS